MSDQKKQKMYLPRLNSLCSLVLLLSLAELATAEVPVQDASANKGRQLYATKGCPTCHGLEKNWHDSNYKVTFPNTRALVGFSAAVNEKASENLDEAGYIEHFVHSVLKDGKNLSTDESKVYEKIKRNPQGVTLMASMIKSHFTKASEAQKNEEIKAIADYIRAFRKNPALFK
ncbi:MAG: c-type cytochrome [Deltaproteobacteria bacterium]|nr:c-type cytochrome [Deltaproteobacteria bacterium]